MTSENPTPPHFPDLVRRYITLLEVNDLIHSYRDLGELFRHLASCLRRVLTFDFIGVALHDKQENIMRLAFIEANIPSTFPSALPMEEAPAGWVYENQQTLIVTLEHESRYPLIVGVMRKYNIQVAYLFPLTTSITKLGALMFAFCDAVRLEPSELDFFQKVTNQLALAIENAINFDATRAAQEKLTQEKVYLEEEIGSEFNFKEIVGESTGLKDVLRQVATVADSGANVLIHGETGTGKELIARAIHDTSPRCRRTFVKLNCSAIPTGLLESELFGHERGAFTGAIAQKIGRFELADGGTLFLDEIGDIQLELQPKLLRAIQEREFERLGSTRTKKVDVRIVAATHRDLQQMISERQFRSDLYYRLNVFPIHVPPLRERRADIPRLARYFTTKYSKRMDRKIETIPHATMQALQDWAWPGNVRELENLIERAVILSRGPELLVPLSELRTVPNVPAGSHTDVENERENILHMLRETHGQVAKAAVRLGMKRSTLQYRMKKLSITRSNLFA